MANNLDDQDLDLPDMPRGFFHNPNGSEFANLEAEKRRTYFERRTELHPCPYKNDNTCVTYFYADLGGGKYAGRKICNIAADVKREKHSFIFRKRIIGRLRRIGCPEPTFRFFGGWECRYADGEVHGLSSNSDKKQPKHS